VVEADVLELDPLRLHAEAGGDLALEGDRDVAQAERPMSGIEQRLGHQARGVGEVDEPRAGGGPAGGLLGQLEHDRHRPQGLREPAGAGGLLADAPVLRGDGLVEVASAVAADAQLDDHEGRAVERLVAVERAHEAPAEAGAAEHPLGQPAHDLQAFGVDVEERELLHREPVGAPREPLDELRRVGAAGPDHGDLHTHRGARLHCGR